MKVPELKWYVRNVSLDCRDMAHIIPVVGFKAELEAYLDPNRCPAEFKLEDVANKLSSMLDGRRHPEIKKVIFNDPATIILWKDDTKTVVQCQEGDVYSAETGFALAYLKKLLGNDNTFNKEITKWVPEEKAEEKTTIPSINTVPPQVRDAYTALMDIYTNKKARKADLEAAIEEALGCLGEVLM